VVFAAGHGGLVELVEQPAVGERPSRAQRVDRDVRRDAIEPGAQARVGQAGGSVQPGAQKDLLRKVLGERGVADTAAQVPPIGRRCVVMSVSRSISVQDVGPIWNRTWSAPQRS
jgi:hypothetical protein